MKSSQAELPVPDYKVEIDELSDVAMHASENEMRRKSGVCLFCPWVPSSFLRQIYTVQYSTGYGGINCKLACTGSLHHTMRTVAVITSMRDGCSYYALL